MANEGEDKSMVAPETEKLQAPSGEASASSIHGDAESSSPGRFETLTGGYDGDDEDEKKKLDDEDDDIIGDHPKTLECAKVLIGEGSTAPETEKPQSPSGKAIASSIHEVGESSSRGRYDGDDKKKLDDEDDDIIGDHPKTLECAEVLIGEGSTAPEIEKPQAPSGEAIALPIHGEAESSSLGSLRAHSSLGSLRAHSSLGSLGAHSSFASDMASIGTRALKSYLSSLAEYSYLSSLVESSSSVGYDGGNQQNLEDDEDDDTIEVLSGEGSTSPETENSQAPYGGVFVLRLLGDPESSSLGNLVGSYTVRYDVNDQQNLEDEEGVYTIEVVSTSPEIENPLAAYGWPFVLRIREDPESSSLRNLAGSYTIRYNGNPESSSLGNRAGSFTVRYEGDVQRNLRVGYTIELSLEERSTSPETENPQAPSGGAFVVRIRGDPESSSLGHLVGSYTLRYDGYERPNLEHHTETLEYANELVGEGFTALNENDYLKTADCYSRALEIQVAHFGDRSGICFRAYYYYGLAVLRSAVVDLYTPAESNRSCASSNVESDESSDAEHSGTEDSASSITMALKKIPKPLVKVGCLRDCHGKLSARMKGLEEEENDGAEFDTEDTPDNDENEPELDLAWQILEIARVIIETQPTQVMDNVNILCLLAETNLYREDLETSLEDYHRAVHLLESINNPDIMARARLYFNMGLCLESAVLIKEAILFCENSIRCCSSVVSSLVRDICSLSPRITLSESGEELVETSTGPPQSDNSTRISEIEAQIASARDYSIMVEHKLEELREIQKVPRSNISEAIDALSGKVRQVVPENDVSTASTSTSTNVEGRYLGKLGGSVKKVSVGMIKQETYSDSIQSSPSKKPRLG